MSGVYIAQDVTWRLITPLDPDNNFVVARDQVPALRARMMDYYPNRSRGSIMTDPFCVPFSLRNRFETKSDDKPARISNSSPRSEKREGGMTTTAFSKSISSH
jgi:hypothetical protein